MLTGFDPNQIQELEGARQAITRLLNLVEEVKQENDQLRETIQRLRDEINRLKGEQGKPDIKPGKKKEKTILQKKNGGNQRSGKKEVSWIRSRWIESKFCMSPKANCQMMPNSKDTSQSLYKS